MSFLSDLFTTGARRDLSGPLGKFVVKPYAALVSLGIVYVTTIEIVPIFAMTIVVLGLMLALTFVSTSGRAGSSRIKMPAHDIVLALLALVASGYFWFQNERVVTRITLLDELTVADVMAGSALLLLTLEATRRTAGLGLALVVLAFLGYNLWGDMLPGVLGHGVIDYNHFLDILVFTTDGLFGVPIRVALTYVFLFGLFGTFLSRAGGGDFFFDVAAALSGKSPGGPAKIAVISSGLYGTISGSPTADVVTTGSITVPMMKRLGYSGTLAGGIEVAASTGGGILPPVMGSAAFIMMDFTGIPYQEIAVAAIVPAMLYYFCIYLQVHLRSLKLGLRGLDEDQIPILGKTLKAGWQFIVPLIALVIALLLKYSPNYVAVFGTLALIGVVMLKKETRLTFKATYEILAEATMRVVPVVAACAAAGLVVGGLSMTGLGAKTTELVFLLAGSNMLASLLIAAAITILLGMGMPTPSVYILAAVLVAPALVHLGVSVLAANLFLVYFACLSALTPPVAVAAFAVAPIADANPLGVAAAAVRIALTAFVVPFAFVYSNELLLAGDGWRIVLSCIAAVVAVWCLCTAAEGYCRRDIRWGLRVLFAAAGIGLLAPSLSVRAGAFVVVVVALLLAFRPQPSQTSTRLPKSELGSGWRE